MTQNPHSQIKQIKCEIQGQSSSLMKSYKDYEDMEEIQAQPDNDGSLLSYQALNKISQ